MCMRVFLLILLGGVVIGCSPVEKVNELPVAASADDVAGVVCAIATNKFPVATGFFVSYRSTLDLTNRYYLVTAAHVGSKLRDEMMQMMVATKDRKHSIFELCVSPWQYHETADVCVSDVTPEYERLVKSGADVHCIDLVFNPTNRLSCASAIGAVKGIGVMHRAVMREFGIGLASDCLMLGTSVETFDCLANRDEIPLVCRSGKIAQLPKGLSHMDRNRMRRPTYLFLTDIPVVHGTSGAPCVVRGMCPGGRSYWYLAGVTVSILPSRDEANLVREGMTFHTNETGRLVGVDMKKYDYRGNPFLSYVVPFDAVQECIDVISPGISLESMMR